MELYLMLHLKLTFRLKETNAFKTQLLCILHKQHPEKRGYTDDKEGKGGIKGYRMLTFQCATQRLGAILLQSKGITFLLGIREVTVNAC